MKASCLLVFLFFSTPFLCRAPADADKQEGEPLLSKVKLSIPFRADNGKEQLIEIDAVFSSSAERKADGNYEYTYRWEDRKAADRPKVNFDWKSQSVGHAVAGKATPAIPRLELSKCAKQVRMTSPARPDYAITTIEFLDREGKHVVGSGVVSIYFPTGQRP